MKFLTDLSSEYRTVLVSFHCSFSENDGINPNFLWWLIAIQGPFSLLKLSQLGFNPLSSGPLASHTPRISAWFCGNQSTLMFASGSPFWTTYGIRTYTVYIYIYIHTTFGWYEPSKNVIWTCYLDPVQEHMWHQYFLNICKPQFPWWHGAWVCILHFIYIQEKT